MMDESLRGRNWILLDQVENSPRLPSDRRYSFGGPLGASTSRSSLLAGRSFRDPEQRIHSINKLNDRIHRKIASNYFYQLDDDNSIDLTTLPISQSIREGRDTFRRHGSPEERLDRLIRPHDDDTIYEEEPPTVHIGHSITDPSQSASNGAAAWELNLIFNNRDRNRSIERDSFRERALDQNVDRFRLKRSDSVDSGSMRLARESKRIWNIASSLHDDAFDREGDSEATDQWDRERTFWRRLEQERLAKEEQAKLEEQARREREEKVKLFQMQGSRLSEDAPSLLRRNSHFYQTCDLCAFRMLRSGEVCAACGNRGQPLFSSFVNRSPERAERGERGRLEKAGCRRAREMDRGRDLTFTREKERERELERLETLEREARRGEPYPKGDVIPPYDRAFTAEPPFPSLPRPYTSMADPYGREKPHILRAKSRTFLYPGESSSPFAPPPPPYNIRPGEILSARALKRTPAYREYNVPPRYPHLGRGGRPQSRGQQSIDVSSVADWRRRRIYPAQWPPPLGWRERAALKRPRSPVFRYGRHMPAELYDYDMYARRKERRRRQRRALALALGLLALALVVSAGVVMAAIRY